MSFNNKLFDSRYGSLIVVVEYLIVRLKSTWVNIDFLTSGTLDDAVEEDDEELEHDGLVTR